MATQRSYPVCHAILYRKGPRWREGVTFWEQAAIDDHSGYMDRLAARGVLVLGGPFTDSSGGLLVLRRVDASEARRIAEHDPAVRAGVLSYEHHPLSTPVAAPGLELA